ncbi:hypothetical protein [Streptomyces griseoaurantiacus]|uniref:hypothetical protein n=1 Tax=Streptomyces griseoaurantiacus TaxID=68213 RepID=UPI0011124E55|nr:hypothetical protein [Streptomyces griseoaurantiacus]
MRPALTPYGERPLCYVLGVPWDHVEVSGGKLVEDDSDTYDDGDEDGEYVGQTCIGTQHQAPGRTDADKSEFTAYGTSEDKHELSDITSVKGAHVERTAPAD